MVQLRNTFISPEVPQQIPSLCAFPWRAFPTPCPNPSPPHTPQLTLQISDLYNASSQYLPPCEILWESSCQKEQLLPLLASLILVSLSITSCGFLYICPVSY